ERAHRDRGQARRASSAPAPRTSAADQASGALDPVAMRPFCDGAPVPLVDAPVPPTARPVTGRIVHRPRASRQRAGAWRLGRGGRSELARPVGRAPFRDGAPVPRGDAPAVLTARPVTGRIVHRTGASRRGGRGTLWTPTEHAYSLLNMSSASVDELAARARILQAAIRRFAADGMSAPLRAIAADAGVSAGLIIHHFGSADRLREACDEHVLAVTRHNKESVVAR